MEVNELKKVLGRFQRCDYADIVQQWVTTVGPLSRSEQFQNVDSPSQLSKKDFVHRSLRSFGKKTPEINDVAKLDLMYVQKHSRKRLWKVYCLQERRAKKTPEPKLFLAKFKRELKLFFNNVEVHLAAEGPIYWLRVRIHPDRQGGKRQVPVVTPTYLLHYPHSDHLLISSMRAAQSEYLSQACLNVLGGTQMNALPLSGHCVQSLFQLALHPHSQGSFSQFRLNLADSNPLRRGKKRKRSQNESEDDLDCRILYENSTEKKQRMELLTETFGTNPQPCLEKVEYVLETKFKGSRYAPGMAQKEGLFHVKVRFDGPNVLEGIRGLGKAGLAQVPMKDHVGKIPSLSKNAFLLRQKGLPGSSQSQSQLSPQRG